VAWGANDSLSSRVRLDAVTTALSSLVGQLLVCLAFGFAAHATGEGGGEGAPSFGLPQLYILGANALEVFGWLAFVRLGQLGMT
jgi:hypothetical protein